ncbi:molecular chaperone DnaJ [Balneola sp. MJW-20]|uniref:molecular chaperone DnaJ n=1 Tax=Gracilimonas aurantiaca TaxID=3234185 RepID=UPI00346637F5
MPNSEQVLLLNYEINLWFWVALVEFIVLTYLIAQSYLWEHSTEDEKFRSEAIDSKVDFGNIINSSFNASKLYDSLKVKCHPDRFASDDKKNQIASHLFQEITRNKNNIKRLGELKEKAIAELNIKF